MDMQTFFLLITFGILFVLMLALLYPKRRN